MLYDAEQVKLMFDEHAILFYDQEGVTFYDAIRFFGNSAFEWAFHCGERDVDILCFGDPEMSLCEPFVSYRGFCLVATYANLLELRRMRKEAGMKVDPLPDVSLEPKPKKASGPKVVDIRPMLKEHAAIAARQKVR